MDPLLNDPIEAAVRSILESVDPDPRREGLQDTPKRVASAFRFWTQGYSQEPKELLTTFQDSVGDCNEMIVVADIPVHSLCEHHIATFWGKAVVAYIPDKRVIGLSKIPRLVHVYMRRLQIQERLTNQIADAIEEYLKPLGCGVTLQCRHMCMESRGVQLHGTVTTTSALRGVFHEASTRAEYFNFVPKSAVV